jgi:hypothetical protein
MYQDLLHAMENNSISSIEDQLWKLIENHEENTSRSRSLDFPVDTSTHFRGKIDAFMDRFLEELACGRLDISRAKNIAQTLISVRCYAGR